MSSAFMKSIDLLLEEYDYTVDTEAQETDTDPWVLAAGGNSVPFIARDGKKFLLVWNPKLRVHGYMEIDTDTIITDDEFNKEK